MNKFGPFVFVLLLAVLPAMAVVEPVSTHQCWDFSTSDQYGIMPEDTDNTFGGLYGGPVAMIQNMADSEGIFFWSQEQNGYWEGSEFKIILDIPNQPIANAYKNLTVTIEYLGDVSFIGAMGIHVDDSVEMFDAGDSTEYVFGAWEVYTQQFHIEPNPREEIVTIGFRGNVNPARLGRICIDTVCVPEPATMVLLAFGTGYVLRRKNKKEQLQN